MTIHEPTTVATDFLLAILATAWGVALWRNGSRRRQASPRLLAACFLATALGAALGGTAHGFIDALAPEALARIWQTTTISLGVAGYLLLAAAVTATLAAMPGRVVLFLGGVKLGVYIVWMTRHQEFYWVILEYGTSMLVVAALMTWRAARARGLERAGPLWVLAGIGLSVVGSTVQSARLAPHPQFNHNDLYHVIQMVALYAFYRAGLALTDAAAESKPAAARNP